MAPLETLYGCKCRTPLFWNQTGETQVFGTDVLRNAEQQVQIIWIICELRSLMRRAMQIRVGEK